MTTDNKAMTPAQTPTPVEWKLVPVEPTEEMIEAALEESGWRVEPYTSPRESGVPIECDMSVDDAAAINQAGRDAHAATFRVMLAASPTPPATQTVGEAQNPQTLGKIATTLSMFVSVIKSGEAWSQECEAKYKDAFDTLVTINAALSRAPADGELADWMDRDAIKAAEIAMLNAKLARRDAMFDEVVKALKYASKALAWQGAKDYREFSNSLRVGDVIDAALTASPTSPASAAGGELVKALENIILDHDLGISLGPRRLVPARAAIAKAKGGGE